MTSMKKIFKVTGVVFLIFSFFLSTIFCCCLEKVFAANPTPHLAHCHGQSNKANHSHDSHTDHDCMCPKMVSDDFSKTFDIQLISAHFYQEFLKEGAMLVAFLNIQILTHTALLADRSPPSLLRATIPIYLKISVLRI